MLGDPQDPSSSLTDQEAPHSWGWQSGHETTAQARRQWGEGQGPWGALRSILVSRCLKGTYA